MALYSTFCYGTGILYGPSASIGTVDPIRGPSTGGNNFVIDGSGFANAHWSSFFTGAVLDPLKFADVLVGFGSATTGVPNLVLSSGDAPGGIGAVESVATWTDAQGEAVVYILPITAYPASEVVLSAMTLYIDATNYAMFGVYLSTSSSTLVLRATVVRGGVPLSTKEVDWTTGLSKLKILRWGTTLYFYANGALFHEDERFVNTAATFRLSCANQAATYTITSNVQAFYWRPYAVFDSRPVHDSTVVSEGRLRGQVPPSRNDKGKDAAYSGLVDVSVVGVGSFTATDAYEYYYEDQLTIINSGSSDIKVSLLSDALLKTPSASLRGLGNNK